MQLLWTRPLVAKSALIGIMSFFSLQLRFKNDYHQQLLLQQQQHHSLLRKHVEGKKSEQRPMSSLVVTTTMSEANNGGSEQAVTSTAPTTSTPQLVASYHKPPSSSEEGTDDYYKNNPTVFGQILRGEIPTVMVAETNDLLMFQDIHHRAPMHDLIIPKQYIPSVFELDKSNLPLLYEMRDLALQKLQQKQPVAFRNKDYRLVFHVPPFNSVDHLHLHVVAPASQMTLFRRFIKYSPRDYRWCVSLETVLSRLQQGKTPVPWSTREVIIPVLLV